MENLNSQIQLILRRLKYLEKDVKKLKAKNRAHTLKNLTNLSAKSRPDRSPRRTSKRVPSSQRKSASMMSHSRSRNLTQPKTGRDVILPTGERKFVPDLEYGERIQFYDATNTAHVGTVVNTLDHDVPEVEYDTNKRARIYYYPDKDRYEIVR